MINNLIAKIAKMPGWSIGLALPLLFVTLPGQSQQQQTLSLQTVIKAAQRNDPWLTGNRYRQQAIEAKAVAVGTLPDPRVSVGVANLAVDSFDFDQEAMTQLKIGIAQMLPRGDSLQLKQQRLTQVSGQYPLQRKDRQAKMALDAGKVWLDAFLAQQSVALIEQNRALFEQLVDVAQASYSSNVGKTRQHDIVRAQLELTRLEDRLTVFEQQQLKHSRRLWLWLSGDFVEHYLPDDNIGNGEYRIDMPLAAKLPNIRLIKPHLFANGPLTSTVLVSHLSNHPAMKVVAQKIKASTTSIQLAKQKYRPQWGLNASFGYRDNMPSGADRADFLSVGVSFDVPLYGYQQQDNEVAAAVAQAESVKTEKWLVLRRFIASVHTMQAQLQRLEARRTLYQSTLLPQMHDQAEAALTTYTNDDGDFAEVVRARIAELNAQIDALAIDVARQKTILELNYYLVNDQNQDIINTGA